MINVPPNQSWQPTPVVRLVAFQRRRLGAVALIVSGTMSRASKFEVLGWFALVAVYVTTYFLLVRPVIAVHDRITNRCWVSPGYGPLPAELFSPVHWIDEKVLRPKMWSFPGTLGEYNHFMGWDL